MMYNARTVKTSLKRIELCDLMIACTTLEMGTGAKKWGELHDKLEKIISEFDKEYEKDLLRELENI